MAVICNEFTNECFPHSHSQIYLKTKHPKTFKSVKKFCKKALHTTVNDIQRPLNFRETVRYNTKIDPKAKVYNVPTKFCGTVWRAHQYAQTHNTVIWSDDLPSGIAACDRKVFESHVKMEKMADENAIVVNRTDHELLYWQKRLLTLSSECEEPDRAVFWVVDTVGGCGKSFLEQKRIVDKGALQWANQKCLCNSFQKCLSIVMV